MLYLNIPNDYKEIKKRDPYQFVKEDLDDGVMYDILVYILEEHEKKDFNIVDKIVNNISISSKRNDFLKDLNFNLILLKTRKILTSRLAVIIYRLLKLDLYASTTKIGRYFNKKTGNKSQVFNSTMLITTKSKEELRAKSRAKSTKLDYYNSKNFRGYDLNVNSREIAIRKEIANKLKERTSLTTEEIIEITGLPINESL